MTVPSLAVGWVLAQQGVTGAIVGARRPAHVDGWSAAGEGDLGEAVLRQIDELIAEAGAGTDERPSPPPHMREPAPDEEVRSRSAGR
jgi:diketogulonate reductase-like aldo/keto reductase